MMIWHITGGRPLSGTLAVQGSKNAVLPILAASILAPCETLLTGVPDLKDVRITLRILEHLGCAVTRERDRVLVDSRPLCRAEIPHSLMRELRSSVIFLGAILARCGAARLSLPGGCELGPRPVDLHLEALRALGAEVAEQGGDIVCRGGALTGGRVILPFPSVGATENAMLAACAARGATIISNAAREPEIVDLQVYLRALGARISGAGSAGDSRGGLFSRGLCSPQDPAGSDCCGNAFVRLRRFRRRNYTYECISVTFFDRSGLAF